MIVNCPNCKARYDLAGRGPIPMSVRLRCSACHAVFVVKRKPLPQPSSNEVRSSAIAERAIILIAHESAEVRRLLTDIISSEPHFRILTAADGPAAIQVLSAEPVSVMVSDVALPGLLGFEVAGRLKQNDILGTPKVILLASIYNHTRYKRSPAQLYDCHDYLEKHHVHDLLIPKINKLVFNVHRNDESPAAGSSDSARINVSTEKLPEEQLTPRQEAILKQAELGSFTDSATPADHDNARRLARIIVSDIALYSQEAISEGLKGENVDDFLSRQFDEARILYRQRVPDAVRRDSDYLEQAIREYVSTFSTQQTS